MASPISARGLSDMGPAYWKFAGATSDSFPLSRRYCATHFLAAGDAGMGFGIELSNSPDKIAARRFEQDSFPKLPPDRHESMP
jgi:hypothetical protein